MSYILTDIGEEWYAETAIDGATVTFGLYNDGTDSISDGDDLSTITTEPSDGNYVRQSNAVTLSKINGDWGFSNSAQVIFDTQNTTGTVDGAFMVVNFASDETGDSSANDHLIATGQLSQSRDLSQVDEFQISTNEIGVTLN